MTGGLFCAAAGYLSWANAIRGGHGGDTFSPLPSLSSSQYPEIMIVNVEAA